MYEQRGQLWNRFTSEGDKRKEGNMMMISSQRETSPAEGSGAVETEAVTQYELRYCKKDELVMETSGGLSQSDRMK